LEGSVTVFSCGAVAGDLFALSLTSRVVLETGCEEIGAADIESPVFVIGGFTIQG
jgi:hypothetical protein